MGGQDYKVVVIQRVVPNYRRAIFRKAYDELGWIVATGEEPHAFGLDVTGKDEPWLRRFPIRRTRRLEYGAILDIGALHRQTEPDAVLAEFSLQMSSTWQLAWHAIRRKGPRLAFWSQGANVERGFIDPRDVASQIARLGLMRAADAQLCYSEDGANYLRRHMPVRQKIFVAPNTLDTRALQSRTIDLSPPNGGDANILMIGRMTADKKFVDGVEVFRILRRMMPGVRLTIVGDGPEMPNVRAAAAQLGDSVNILGTVYDEESLDDIYRRSTIMLVAGSAGLNVNQALGYGVPVILFNNARTLRHHPEHSYVHDAVNGYRVTPTSPQAMAERLRSALASGSPRRGLAPGIEQTVREELSLDRMMSGMRELHSFFRGLPRRS